MGGQTKGHNCNWALKLTMHYWNFRLGNAHTIYAALVKKYTTDCRALYMPGCVFLTYHLLQQGDIALSILHSLATSQMFSS
jgi:hypothetical protein